MTDVEQRYSRIEKEALALVWACEKFHVYIYGKSSTLVADHKPLEFLFNKPGRRPQARIERWTMRLQEYDFTVCYKPGSNNPADYLSRHPVPLAKSKSIAEEYVNFIASNTVPRAMTRDEVRDETNKDLTMQKLKECLRSGKWSILNQDKEKFQGNHCFSDLQAFKRIEKELSVTEDGIVLRETRIVMPQALREKAVEIAHEGHLGIVKTKGLTREKVWFPGIDKLVENKTTSCIACQATIKDNKLEPLKMQDLANGPWEVIAVDFKGPIGENHKYILVCMDEFSRYPEIEIVPSTSENCVIPKLEKIFSTHGIPFIMKSDNGSPFNGSKMKEFAKQSGYIHRRITPEWPRANGECERFMRNLNKVIQATHIEGKSWQQEVFNFVRNYRASPHATTGIPPAKLLMGRNIRTKLPEHTDIEVNKDLRDRDEMKKRKMKEYADEKNHASESDLTLSGLGYLML